MKFHNPVKLAAPVKDAASVFCGEKMRLFRRDEPSDFS
jgi:hypothetical protein